MKYDPDKHHRRSIRLKGYDYAQPGAYFVTILTKGRENVLSEIIDGGVCLSAFGEIVDQEWMGSATIRREIELDVFVIMPNHVHGIVFIQDGCVSYPVRAHGRAPLHRKPRSLGAFVAGFKSSATKRINALCATPGTPVWQHNFYEHVIRSESELNDIREYVLNNPIHWEEDENHPRILQDQTVGADPCVRPRGQSHRIAPTKGTYDDT